jgi:serine/threonine protein kinase
MEPLSANDPRMIGDFRLHAQLGAGGMGQVYLGFSPAGRAVAVKVIHPQFARDQEFLRRFSHEVAAASAVGGMYTAPVVDYDLKDAAPWLATAYVPGPTLAAVIGKYGALPEAAVWRLAAGLAEALRAVHAKDLIHRDLKPANVLLADNGPHVIDFGISRATASMTQLTSAGTAIGTPGYMSPEQAQVQPVGPASDVFSLGSVLAFAATGAAPFGGAGTEMFAIAYRVVNGEPDLSRVPAALRPVIDACLAKDSAARPAVGQLIADVAAGATAHPGVTPGRFWPDQVAAVLESSAFTPVLPPPAPLTRPPLRSPATEPASGAPYPPTEAAVAGEVAISGHAFSGHYRPTPAEAATVDWWRRGPRWLLPTALSVAVAVGAAIAIILALSSSPKPPTFLNTPGSSPAV